MTGHDDDRFSEKEIDEQIGRLRPDSTQPTAGDQLLHDMQMLARSEQQKDHRSLEHIWQQVQASREQAVVSPQMNERTLLGTRKLTEAKKITRKGKEAMEENNILLGTNLSTPYLQAKKRGSKIGMMGIALVAAVVVITILSFAVFSGVLRPAGQRSSTITGAAHKPNTISHATLVCSFDEHESAPWPPDLSWSTQGQIAVANYTNVEAYSATNCSQTFSLSPLQHARGVLWSPDGNMLVVSEALSGMIDVLDSHGKELTKTLLPVSRGSRVFDGSKIIVGALCQIQARCIKSLNVNNVKQQTTLMQTPLNTYDQFFSPDHKLVLLQNLNTANESLEIWNIQSRKKITTLALQGIFTGGAFSPDGSQIAISTMGTGKIQIFSTVTGRLLTVFDKQAVSPPMLGNVLAWSPDGKYIADGSTGIKIYNVKAQKITAIFGKVAGQDGVTKLTWSPDSAGLASVTTQNEASRDLHADTTLNTINVWQMS